MVVLIAYVLVLNFCAVSTLCSQVWVTEWPPIGKMAAHSAYNMLP